MGAARKSGVLIALLLAASLGLSGCGSKAERTAEHLKKAREFYTEADYDKARVESKNVLQLDPKSADGYQMRSYAVQLRHQHSDVFDPFWKTSGESHHLLDSHHKRPIVVHRCHIV